MQRTLKIVITLVSVSFLVCLSANQQENSADFLVMAVFVDVCFITFNELVLRVNTGEGGRSYQPTSFEQKTGISEAGPHMA